MLKTAGNVMTEFHQGLSVKSAQSARVSIEACLDFVPRNSKERNRTTLKLEVAIQKLLFNNRDPKIN